MKSARASLWNWEGTIDRGPYLVIGLLLFALKHNLDRWAAWYGFQRTWSVFNYWMPDAVFRLTTLPENERRLFVSLWVLALPFIWIGMVLTVRRLRAVRLPSGLALLFFIPVVNLALFLVLSLLPSRRESPAHPSQDERARGLLHRVIPDHPWGSAALGVLLAAPVAGIAVWLGAGVLNQYGWGLFVGIPFGLGFVSVMIYGYHEPRGFGSCLAVSMAAVVLAGAGLMAVAVEGLICLLMAAPLAVVMALLGGFLGYILQRRPSYSGETAHLLLLLFLMIPALMGAEYVSPPEPPQFAVRTAVDIDAAPDRVWRRVVAFAELPAPREWLFRAGIAYPIRAEIQGAGVGAVRHCVFSTGAFTEPIEVWAPPRLLKFSVTANPPPMQEWTPYAQIHPPHLDGFLISQGGQFLLTPRPGGRTRLEGTTWYRHHMWPAAYWQAWSDFIIHRIHQRVLGHIKQRVEAE